MNCLSLRWLRPVTLGGMNDSRESRQGAFLPHDAPLREDVRRLGVLVGEMLAEQGGGDFYAQVEAVRTAAIARRESGAGIGDLAAMLAGRDPAHAEALARAFEAYFQSVNVAERVHRIRRHRDYQLAGAAAQPESLADVLETLRARGVDAGELRTCVDRLDIEPVFTAHPTEAVRGSLLEKESEIVRALIAGFDPGRTPGERAADTARMRMAITAGWQTAEASPVRPSVQDEIDHVGYYLAGPLYRVLPVFYETLERELRVACGLDRDPPRVLRFASWVGGDMDGNPNVGADTIAETLRTQRAVILQRYIAECASLARLLSQTEGRVGISVELRQRIEDYRRQLPETAQGIRPRHADMPYRIFLTLMRARLQATLADRPQAYADADEFLGDVKLVESSLRAHKGVHAGLFAVRRLYWRLRTFGFHLARLDVRQDARAHDDVLAVLLDDADWPRRDADTRTQRLRPYASGETRFADSDAVEATALRDVFATLADARKHYGSDATGPYVISMARSAADVLAVLALARLGGLVDADGSVPLDVAPLFETIDDLKHAAATLRALLADPVYRAHLAARGGHQIVMLGYSDSGKDGGIVASRWALQRAQVELLEVAKEARIGLTFFHGRGGSASRGGSRITPALMASPRGAVAGRLRVTEQGEVIHRKYGIRALALRNLEQTVGAVLRASLRPRDPEPREEIWRGRMTALAGHGREAYRALVTDDDFVAYFRRATPIDVIEHMTLGSRPSRRREMRGIEDLRAIPWVFAWTQCRAIVPGWFGVGSALQRGVETFGEDALAEMARDWPFMATLLDDVEMVLAKADLGIAEAFSGLAGELHPRFFPRIRAEFERTFHWLLQLKRQDALLAGDRRLALSIRLRNPYVDPMSLLQVDLLRRWRATGSTDEALLRALVACVNGVSQGLQNTG
jgi:phosphoenolpyruvate carboxylase